MRFSFPASIFSLLLASSSLSVSFAFVVQESGGRSTARSTGSNQHYHQQQQHLIATLPLSYDAGISSRRKTALSMGLRSFIKRKVLRNENGNTGGSIDNDNDNDNDQHGGDAEVPPSETTEPVRYGSGGSMSSNKEDDRYRRDIVDEESTQDRINRIKKGRMTEDEKAAFLRTALTSSNTVAGQVPLRQEIVSAKENDPRKKNESASPFPKDLLSLGKGNSQDLTTKKKPSIKIELDSDKKKKAYYDMVTSPNRFKTYITPENSDEPSALIDNEIDELQKEVDVVRKKVKTTGTSSSPSQAVSPKDMDLAARLEQGAYAEEQRTKELRKKQEQLRRKQEEKLLELQRQRNEEIEKREAAALERKRAQDAELERITTEKAKAEQKKLQEMQAAQDSYWAKKLQNDKQKQFQKLTEEQREEEKRKAEDEVGKQKLLEETERQKEKERVRLVEAAEKVSNASSDGEIPEQAKEDKLQDEDDRWKEIETEEAEVTKTTPKFNMLNDVRPIEQEIVKPDIGQSGDSTLNQLRSMNSPLPTPSNKVKSMNSPLPTRSPVPQVAPPAPSPAPRPAPVRLATPPPSPQSINNGPSVRDMMAQANDDGDDFNDQQDSPPKGGTGLGGLGALGRLLGNNNRKSEEKRDTLPKSFSVQTILAQQSPVPPPAPVPPAAKIAPPPAPPARKASVRMQVPIDVKDEDEEFDQFTRRGPNKNVSIADAMKNAGDDDDSSDDGKAEQAKKSKMWGIDMSKFD